MRAKRKKLDQRPGVSGRCFSRMMSWKERPPYDSKVAAPQRELTTGWEFVDLETGNNNILSYQKWARTHAKYFSGRGTSTSRRWDESADYKEAFRGTLASPRDKSSKE